MLIAINLVLGLLAVGGLLWDITTGQVGSMDGNFLLVVCLALAALFFGGAATGIRNGELKEIFSRIRTKNPRPQDETKS